jgi:xylan 1,4-beta-xylosidase
MVFVEPPHSLIGKVKKRHDMSKRNLMKLRLPLALTSAGLLAVGIGSGMMSPLPAQAVEMRVEAEANPIAGDLKIIEDAAASGGKAVSMAREWQPLLAATLPEKGDEWTLWMHHKNGPLLAKTATKDGQKDLKWIWDKPAGWKWTKLGRFNRAALGERVLIIRGGKQDGPDAILDCIAFIDDDAAVPGGPNITTAAARQNTNNQTADTGAMPESAAVALGAVDAPKGTLIEAEANNPGGDNRIVDAAGASGGKAVTSDGDWQTLFQAPLPAGDAWKVWVRHKHGPLSVKSVEDGKGKDNWNWKSPATWAWTDMGTFSRAQLGDSLRIGRQSRNDQPSPLVDAVVLAPDVVKVLPPFEPDTNAAPLTIKARVNWNQTAGQMKPAMWGWNDYEVLYPERAANAEYQKALAALNTPLVRIHNAGFSNAWTNAATRSWDVEKIRAGLKASTGFGKARIMMNVAEPPNWISDSKLMTPEQEDEFARLCGQLVRVMRDEVKVPVDYWEMTNEFDTSYEKSGRLDDLWRVFNKVVKEVRAADPKARVGGPALTWPKPVWVEGFFKNCGQNTDFFTWHNYASGDIYDSNETVFGKAQTIANMAQDVKVAARKWAPERKLEFFLTELNIKWVWDPIERRHGNNIGAAFLASTLRRIALGDEGRGIDGVTMWHAKGGAYGLINGDNSLRSPYFLYRWGVPYLSGRISAATTDDENSLEVLPIRRADQTVSLLLINKAPRTVQIPDGAGLLPAGAKPRIERIDAKGFSDKVDMPLAGTWSLPGYSVTLITTARP